MQGEKAMSKNGNIREMLREDRRIILKKHIVIYELLITALQIAIIIFCFLAYKKVDAVHVEGLGLLLLDSSLGYVMCIFAFAVFTMCISLIRFSMLLVPWFRELWEDAWKDGQPKDKSSKSNSSNTDKSE